MDRAEFDRKVFSILKEMSITPKGFYRYANFSELVGQQKPSWPLTTSLKVMVEILYVKPQKEQIIGFLKSAQDNQVSRSIIFGIDDLTDAEKERLDLTNYNIDYFDYSAIDSLITEKSIIPKNSQDYQKASEVVAPKRLVNALDDFAHQRIPLDILTSLKTIWDDECIHAWNLFEEATYAAFKHCIGYTVSQLGKESPFQVEPDGVAIIESDDKKAFLYECKSAKEVYTMTVDHRRAYVEYIKKKKQEISALSGAKLQYFVIVGPDFGGDIKGRRKQIHLETGVLVVHLKANLLTEIANWSYDIDDKIRTLIDLSELFSEIDDSVVTAEKVTSFTNKFDQKYKTRY